MNLIDCRHWVFDMDGTLTVAVHDFARIRRELDIPAGDDILAHIDARGAEAARSAHAWLLEHERELALAARPAPGALRLVRGLQVRGCRLGVLTRNANALALLTLEAIGLRDCFDAGDVLGRDEAVPKPDPDGLRQLAARWGVAPTQLTMVGDHDYDLACARAAGAHAILVNGPPEVRCALADRVLDDCGALHALLG